MDYKEKLKKRLYIAIIYISVGIIMIVGVIPAKTDNDFTSSFGFALIVMGIIRIRNYFIITKNEETIRRQRISETDERNIAIINRAWSAAFAIYVLFSGTAVIILSLFDKHEIARMIAYSMWLLVVIYWISYWIIRKKS